MHAVRFVLVLAIALLSPPTLAAAATAAPATTAATAPKTASDARAPVVHVVVIENMLFTPATLELRRGDIIEWQNRDMFQHTATARDGAFDVDLVPGATARTVIADAGTLAVYCKFHPNMTATLVVN